jgi:hypothetical protein
MDDSSKSCYAYVQLHGDSTTMQCVVYHSVTLRWCIGLDIAGAAPGPNLRSAANRADTPCGLVATINIAALSSSLSGTI